MMVDFGLPYRHAADVVEMAGAWIDLAKIAVGTSRLYDTTYLRRKLRMYKRHRIRPRCIDGGVGPQAERIAACRD